MHAGKKTLVQQGLCASGGPCVQMSKGLTMVKPESLLLSSSGLELGLLEEAEAGPISGSENTSGEQAGT